MEKEVKVYEIEEKCTLKQKFGKCLIPFQEAKFCLDCFTIHIQQQCPNCLSEKCVRLVELFLSESDPTDDRIREIIKKEFLKKP